MPGFIQRVPQGFLSLLGLKSGGVNAKELSATLISVIDNLDFYLGTIRSFVTATNPAPAIGANGAASLTPDPGEIWLVRQFCAFNNADIAAAATLEVTAGYVPLASGVFIGIGPSSGTKITAQRCMSAIPDSFILQPGDQLGFFTNVLTGAPGTVRMTASIARLSF